MPVAAAPAVVEDDTADTDADDAADAADIDDVDVVPDATPATDVADVDEGAGIEAKVTDDEAVRSVAAVFTTFAVGFAEEVVAMLPVEFRVEVAPLPV